MELSQMPSTGAGAPGLPSALSSQTSWSQQAKNAATRPLKPGAIAGIVIAVLILGGAIAVGLYFWFLSQGPCGVQPTAEDVSKAMVTAAKACPAGLNMTKVADPKVAKQAMSLLLNNGDVSCPDILTAAEHYVRLCSDAGYLEACSSGAAQDKSLLKMTGTLSGCALTDVPVYIYQSTNSQGTVQPGVPCILIRDDLTNEASLERRRNKEHPFGPNPPSQSTLC